MKKEKQDIDSPGRWNSGYSRHRGKDDVYAPGWQVSVQQPFNGGKKSKCNTAKKRGSACFSTCKHKCSSDRQKGWDSTMTG